MQKVDEHAEVMKKIRRYAYVTLFLVALALLSFLIVPRTNTPGGCSSLLVANSKYSCFVSLALSSENASFCGYAQGTYADSCYAQIANTTSNSTMCGKVENKILMNSCVLSIATRTEDYNACNAASEPYLSRCLTNIAVKIDNLTLCGSIKNTSQGQICTSLIEMKGAIDLGEPALCANVSRATDKRIASYILENFTSSSNASVLSRESFQTSSSLLLMANTTYTARDFCYTTLAVQLNNSNLCNNVTPGRPRDLCIGETRPRNSTTPTNTTSALSQCNQLGSYSQECVYATELAQAVQTRNVSICAQLPSGIDTECYGLLAKTYANATYCSYITNATAKSSCVTGS